MKVLSILPLVALLFCSCESDPMHTEQYTQAAALYSSKQYVQALPLLRSAAEAGNPDAQLLLAKC